MRTKVASHKPGNKKRPLGPLYEYTSRGDSNGKVTFIKIDGTSNDTLQPIVRKVKEVKPYQAANASGTYRGGPAKDPHGVSDEIVGITHSDLLLAAIASDETIMRNVISHVPHDKAINGALTSAQRYGDVLLLVSTAEAKKTYSMLKSVFVDLYNFIFKLYKSVKHLKPKEAYAILSDAWLSYRYGFKPLYLELKALYNLLVDVGLFQVRSAYGTSKDSVDLHIPVNGVKLRKGESTAEFDILFKLHTVTHKAGFNYFNSKESRNVDKFAVLGIDLQSILSTIYELIPFSFILDMFVNMGDLLQSFDVKAQVNPINGYITTRLLGEFQYKPKMDTTGITEQGFEFTDIVEFQNARNRRVMEGLSRNHKTKACTQIDHAVTYSEKSHWYWTGDQNYGLSDSSYLNKPLVYNGIHLDDVAGFSFDRSEPPWLSTKRRYYDDKGQLIVECWVRLKEPLWFTDQFIGKTTTAGASLLAVRGKFDSYKSAQQTAHETGSTTGPLFYKGRELSFRQYCERFGICTRGINCGSTYAKIYMYPLVHSGDISRQFFINRTYEDVDFGSNESFFNTFDGEILIREKHSSFEMNLVAELDLSKAQITDLLIFSERLVTAVRKKVKS